MMILEMKGLTKTCNTGIKGPTKIDDTGKKGPTNICMQQMMILYHTGRVRKKNTIGDGGSTAL